MTSLYESDPVIYDPERRNVDRSWQTDGECQYTDPEIFFPETGASSRPAKEICATCDVREQCLQYALRNRETLGIWGGMTYNERRAYRRQLT